MREITGRVAVEADLHVQVDGNPITLTGSGRHLMLDCGDPVKTLSSIMAASLPDAHRRLSGPRALGALADSLDRAGLDLVIVGPQGTLLSLGRGHHSSITRLFTGSNQLDLGRVLTLAPLAGAAVSWQLRHAKRPWLWAAAAALAAAGVARGVTGRASGQTTAGT